jgi:hypothetical protein
MVAAVVLVLATEGEDQRGGSGVEALSMMR